MRSEDRGDSLIGRSAFVSGGTRASGAAIAHELASRGATVAVAGRGADQGEAVARQLRDRGADAHFVRLDLSDEASVAAAVETARDRLGGLDLVVNNAAAIDAVRTAQDGSAVDSPTETFDYMMKVGLYGPFWLFKYTIEEMVERGGGTFVSVSSLAAALAMKNAAGYSASKAALEALSRQVCADYGRLGIRSNVIRLGRMMVPANREAYEYPGHMERARDRVMTPSVAQPSDLAAAVAFLASDASRFINGSIVELDGGEMSLMT